MLGCRWAAYEAKEVHEVGYTNLIGEPLWPSRNTAPGIAAGIGLLSKCEHRPSWGAWYSALLASVASQRCDGSRHVVVGQSGE